MKVHERELARLLAAHEEYLVRLRAVQRLIERCGGGALRPQGFLARMLLR